MNLKSWLIIVTTLLAVTLRGGVAFGQPPPLPPPALGGGETPNVSPLEIQRMFDAYALVQAQDRLKLSDEQFPQFLARFKALQEVRRRLQIERMRALRELNRLLQTEKVEDSAFKDQLRVLQEIESRTSAEVRKAYDSVDQVLDVRQQANFRLFEEMMERRKIELVTRARQNYRPKARPPQ
jgi:Spy/CpxP family protein refolding chaperone